MLLSGLKRTGQPTTGAYLAQSVNSTKAEENLLLVAYTPPSHRLWVWPQDLLWPLECGQM